MKHSLTHRQARYEYEAACRRESGKAAKRARVCTIGQSIYDTTDSANLDLIGEDLLFEADISALVEDFACEYDCPYDVARRAIGHASSLHDEWARNQENRS